ncbi:MAG TPA: endonuclease III [Kiritimatiellia bacterium]|nr:endonuclease III [Kiritimatiellia bacterium]HRZ11820.1 endonuclease III [Kiritimatiellia bacterium]HSA17374.1 endonuclease III [Kiritimatiellia bacterium]
MTRRETDAVFRRLTRAYGPPPRLRRLRPLDALVQTILSQNTSDTNSWRAYQELTRTFRSWPAVAAAPARSIERAIRSGGLARTKAPRIRLVLRLIREREGRLSLARLKRLSDPEARVWLTSLPGVGSKTAACVLLFALGRPVMPVDTHVERVCRRLGWVGAKLPVDQIGPVLERHVPARRMLAMHLQLVRHGRRTCRARKPACARCPLRSCCRNAQ